MKKLYLALALILILPLTAYAQTINHTLQWDDADTLANVNAYTVSLQVDSAAVTVITPTCAQNGSVVTCSTPVTLTSGNHTLIVTNTTAGGSASGTLNFVPPPPGVQPVNMKVIIKITVP